MTKETNNQIATNAATAQKTDEAYAAELLTKMNISATMRYLAAEGWKRGRIAKAMNKRYQHVRNVLTAPVKKTEGDK